MVWVFGSLSLVFDWIIFQYQILSFLSVVGSVYWYGVFGSLSPVRTALLRNSHWLMIRDIINTRFPLCFQLWDPFIGMGIRQFKSGH